MLIYETCLGIVHIFYSKNLICYSLQLKSMHEVQQCLELTRTWDVVVSCCTDCLIQFMRCSYNLSLSRVCLPDCRWIAIYPQLYLLPYLFIPYILVSKLKIHSHIIVLNSLCNLPLAILYCTTNTVKYTPLHPK